MNNNNFRILLVSALPPPVGGDSTWAKNYLDFAKIHNIQIDHVNTSLIGKRAKTTSDTINFFDEIKRCKKIWSQIHAKTKHNKYSISHVCLNCSSKGLIRDYISVRKIVKKNIPVVIHCHCNVKDQISDSRIGIKYFKKICKLVKQVFVLNTDSLNYVSSLTNVKTTILPNFIAENYLIQKTNIRETISKIVFVGHIRKTKGIDELIEAATFYKAIEFHLIGPLTDDYSESQIAFLPKNIFLEGVKNQHEILEILDDSDVFIFPSYTEGFSVALLEAMSRGLPIIATNVGANQEMLENKGGIIINPKNSDELIKAIQSIQNQKLRVEMSSWNYFKVKNEYTINKVVEKIIDYYKALII